MNTKNDENTIPHNNKMKNNQLIKSIKKMLSKLHSSSSKDFVFFLQIIIGECPYRKS